MDKPQIIYHAGEPTFVVIPYTEYLSMQATSTEEEVFPFSLVERVFAGEHPVKVFREWRGYSQGELAERAHSSLSTISKIECGHLVLSTKLQNRLAQALDIDPETLDLPSE